MTQTQSALSVYLSESFVHFHNADEQQSPGIIPLRHATLPETLRLLKILTVTLFSHLIHQDLLTLRQGKILN